MRIDSHHHLWRYDSLEYPWIDEGMSFLRRDHVACKLSGMATEVRDPEWTIETFRTYFETVLDAFGPARLIFGTD